METVDTKKITAQDFQNLESGDIVFWGSENYEEIDRHQGNSIITTSGTSLYMSDLVPPYFKKSKSLDNFKIHQKNNFEKISEEDFQKIGKGDRILWGRGDHAEVKEHTGETIITTSGHEIHKNALIKPYYITQSHRNNNEVKPKVNPPIPKAKEKHPETIKLEVLMQKFPQHNDLIMSQALSGNFKVDEIEAGILMFNAGKELRENSHW